MKEIRNLIINRLGLRNYVNNITHLFNNSSFFCKFIAHIVAIYTYYFRKLHVVTIILYGLCK